MKDFAIEQLEKYDDTERFESLGGGVYRDLEDGDEHSIALSFTSEEGEGQYPMEDLLDEYLIAVSPDSLDLPTEEDAGKRFVVEFQGDEDGIRKAAALVGKRVRNETIIEDGKEYEQFVIDECSMMG